MKKFLQFLLVALLVPIAGLAQQVTTTAATDITQTRATLSATFASGSTQNGFEYKYGTIPTLDDFATLLLTPTSDPVTFTQGSKPWRAVTRQGWVESYYDNSSSSLTSDISTTFTLTEATPIKFEWKVSSQENVGKLQFVVDGTVVQSITGEVDFTVVSYELAAGKHTLKWQYSRTTTESMGDGIGMLRNLDIQNTTADTWLDWPATSSTSRLENLYPAQDYLFRAYSVVGGQKVYSSIRQFRSLSISLGTPRVDTTTQTTATIECDVDAGDAEVEAGIFSNGKLKETLGPIQYATSSEGQLATNSFTIGGSKTSTSSTTTSETLNVIDAFYHASSAYKPIPTMDSQWICYDSYVYNNKRVDNRYITITFTLPSPTQISFEYRVSGGRINYVEDGTTIQCSNSSYTTVTSNLSAGTHTLKWGSYYFSSSSSSYSAYIRNVRIGECEIDTIPINITGDKIFYDFTGLTPNSNYVVASYLIPKYSSPLAERWPVSSSSPVSFTTKNVSAVAVVPNNIRQASATLRGVVHEGDATIVTKGLQYKISTSKNWITVNSLTIFQDSIFARISSLQPNTKYDYRTFIKAEGCDTVFSSTATFTTAAVRALLPEVLSTTQTTARLKGAVDYGDASIYSYGLQIKPASGSEEWSTREYTGESDSFTFDFSGLDVGGSYLARTYVERIGGTFYSDTLTFQTKSIELYVDSITDVYQRSAVIHGRILLGDAPQPTNKSIKLYTIGTTSISLNKTIEISSDGETFSQTVEGLTPKQRYGVQLAVECNGKAIETNYICSEPTIIPTRDDFTMALLRSNSTSYINVTHDDVWQITSRGIGAYQSDGAYNKTVAATFELSRSATISFSYYLYGYNKNNNHYCWLDFKVDGSYVNTNLKVDKGSYSKDGVYSITLPAGRHVLQWRVPDGYYDYYYRIYNLYIPLEAIKMNYFFNEDRAFSTRNYFTNTSVENITQTTATLKAAIEPTNEEGVMYVFCKAIYDDDYEMFFFDNESGEIGEINGGVLSANLIGLTPNTQYNYFVVADDYSEVLEFKTAPVGVNISTSNVTQTSATVRVTTNAGTASISNLQYRVDYGDWKSLSGSTINLTGLAPGSSYRVDLQWTVSGTTYSNYVYINTAKVSVYSGSVTPAQTSALVKMGSYTVGSAKKTASGIIFNGETYPLNMNATVRLTGLAPNTTYTYTYFVETREGGRVSNIAKFTTTSITTVTNPVSNISNRSATLNGTIACDEYSGAEFGFQWKTKQNWTTDPRFTKGRLGEDGVIALTLVNGMLYPDTEYQFRTAVRYGKNADGTDIYYYGQWRDFRTEMEFIVYPATAYTLYRTDSENNRLVLCGYYVAGSETVSRQGYEYWLTYAKGSGSRRLEAVGEVTRVLTDSTMAGSISTEGLQEGVYSLRAFVETASGTVYGNTLTFNVGDVTGIETQTLGNVRCIPGVGHIRVLGANNLSMQIWNAAGQRLTTVAACKDEEQINLAAGVYIVRMSDGQTFKVAVR